MFRKGVIACCLPVALFISVGCSSSRESVRESADRPPLFEGLGHHAWAITTSSSEARDYFNQGLTWTYAFNHDEAIRMFTEAARLDPNCAMAWWGIALCNGPHINNPVMTPDRSKAAWSALQTALSVIQHANYIEGRLIQALASRYAAEHQNDRRALDEAYAAAMKEVYEMNTNDADIGSLYAEALMDLQPWDLWNKDGSAKGNTNEILAVLEQGLKINPQHPGLNHLYIHAVEASPDPRRGIASADMLRELVPISGHLVHMPSHIDVRVGNWAAASLQNERAIVADQKYRAISPKQGFYSVYMAHNHHFLAFASMMEGRSEVALRAAREMIAGVPPEFLREQPEFVDPMLSIVLDVLKRFGRWDDVLREKKPRGKLPIATAMWHYARGVAYAAKGDVRRAKGEQREFRDAVKRVPEGALMGINPAHKVLSIAEKMLDGEIAYRENRIDAAVAVLREGIAIEDDLLYMEPPEWIQPVRHTLGAILVKTGNFSEAESVYRKDLEYWPENGWSLHGLATCLRKRGATAEAEQVESRFAKVWSRSDVNIDSSCLCVPGETSCCETGR